MGNSVRIMKLGCSGLPVGIPSGIPSPRGSTWSVLEPHIATRSQPTAQKHQPGKATLSIPEDPDLGREDM